MFTDKELSPASVEPKVYQIDEHRIAPEQIDEHARYVIHKLRQAGHKAYLVGGGVRDLLLNQKPKDFDVSTSAKPEEIRSLFRNAILIGRRFRLAHVRFGRKIIEVSTFRAGETEAAELIVRDNVWGTEEEDVLRRDFTINGLFYDPEEQVVIDYVGGFSDLEKRVLRTIGKPEIRFTQDPVRMIRLIKFCARLNLEIDRPTFEALLSCKGEITKGSSARILEELLRMLESGASKPFFHLLHEYGLLQPLMPELAHFFSAKPEHGTFPLLEQLDEEIKKESISLKDRSLFLSVLVFPLFDQYLRECAKQQEKPPHLGQIATWAYYVIDCLFHPFFKLPKRMRALVCFILSSQYRFVSLDGVAPSRPRIPRDPIFPFALQLFKFRASVQPDLLPHCTLWTEASLQAHPSPPLSDRRQRRRRRRS